MNNLTETQKGYIAGFIDGEGCIRIAKKRQDSNNYEFSFTPVVLATNTNQEILEKLKEITGIGIVYLSKDYRTEQKKNWRPCHRWQVMSAQARELLRAILPYLEIKKKIAEEVLNFPFTGRGHFRTDENYTKQVNTFMFIKDMNQRGIIQEVRNEKRV